MQTEAQGDKSRPAGELLEQIRGYGQVATALVRPLAGNVVVLRPFIRCPPTYRF